MRLLIVTQKVDRDDSYFGFFHDWLKAFSNACEQVTVITLERRRYTLPENVTVLSLGKEEDSSQTTRLLRFWKYAWQERTSYDVAFCHMSPLYVIAGYPLWKLSGKKIAFWYSHRHVDTKLRVAAKLADVIFSTTSHAFRLRTKKVHFMGHAIDTERFKRPAEFRPTSESSIIAVGRITPIKHLEVLINALGILKQRGVAVKAELVGAPLVDSDKAYEKRLKRLTAEQGVSDRVIFAGDIPFERVREVYWRNTISVNLAPTGGMDKVVLEAAASGLPVIVANTAFSRILGQYEQRLLCKENDAEDVANKIEALLSAPDKEQIGRELQEKVRSTYSLSALMSAMIPLLERA